MKTLKMRQLTFTPRNERDISLVETFFNALGLEFSENEIDDSKLSEKQKEKILRGISDVENCRILTSEQVRERTAKWRK